MYGCLAIAGAIQYTSQEKLYQELGLEKLQSEKWYRKLGMFYKILKNKSLQYLFNLTPEKTVFIYHLVLRRLIQKQKRSFLAHSLSIFYPLKDSKNFNFR